MSRMFIMHPKGAPWTTVQVYPSKYTANYQYCWITIWLLFIILILKMYSRYFNPFNVNYLRVNKHHTSKESPTFILAQGIEKVYFHNRCDRDLWCTVVHPDYLFWHRFMFLTWSLVNIVTILKVEEKLHGFHINLKTMFPPSLEKIIFSPVLWSRSCRAKTFGRSRYRKFRLHLPAPGQTKVV